MYIPGQRLSQDIVNLFVAALNDDRILAELNKNIRTEIDNERLKSMNGGSKFQTYRSLVSGDVNMQAKMAASGYDTYGRTIIAANGPVTNQNTYKKMKNKVKFGRAPQAGFSNRGRYTVV